MSIATLHNSTIRLQSRFEFRILNLHSLFIIITMSSNHITMWAKYLMIQHISKIIPNFWFVHLFLSLIKYQQIMVWYILNARWFIILLKWFLVPIFILNVLSIKLHYHQIRIWYSLIIWWFNVLFENIWNILFDHLFFHHSWNINK